MVEFRHMVRGWRSWRVLLALVCALLVVVSGVVQVAHTHADGADIHANCTLCVSAHVSVHPASAPVPAPAAAVAVALDAVAPSTAVHGTLHTFALFTRPPPADSLPA